MGQVDLRDALRDVAAVGPGMAVLGTSFGLLVVGSGLDWWWAPVFSVVVFAGSLEFLLVALAVAGTPLAGLHVPALEFVFTALFVVLATEATVAGREATGPLLAVACALVAQLVAPGEMLLVAMGLFVAALLVRHRFSSSREAARA